MIKGTFTAPGQTSGELAFKKGRYRFSGPFEGEVVLQWFLDDEWFDAEVSKTDVLNGTIDVGVETPWRLQCRSLVSGSIDYRFG